MLLEKIMQKTAKIGVVGLGYVGLPLAMLCGAKGYRVNGIDCAQEKVAQLQQGRSSITGISEEQLQSLLGQGLLQVTDDFTTVSCCDLLFICVPTPLTAAASPDYSSLFAAVEAIAAKLREQQLVIIESTVTPGTTVEEVLPRLEASGFKVGQDFYLAFSPERIDPANKSYGLENTPKLVAGVTDNCGRMCQEIYRHLGITVIPVATPAVAEMAKLLENVYRDVNIALINEMAEVCTQFGINIWEVITAAASKPFGFQPFYPGLGVGGHCIPKDSSYYIYWVKQKGRRAFLVEQARKINISRPRYVVQRLQEVLATQGKTLKGSKIFVLGVTYKKDVYDLRNSPTLEIIELMMDAGAEVVYHDPFIGELSLGGQALTCSKLDEKNMAGYDYVVLAVPHSCYDLLWLSTVCPCIFDLNNALFSVGLEDTRIARL